MGAGRGRAIENASIGFGRLFRNGREGKGRRGRGRKSGVTGGFGAAEGSAFGSIEWGESGGSG